MTAAATGQQAHSLATHRDDATQADATTTATNKTRTQHETATRVTYQQARAHRNRCLCVHVWSCYRSGVLVM